MAEHHHRHHHREEEEERYGGGSEYGYEGGRGPPPPESYGYDQRPRPFDDRPPPPPGGFQGDYGQQGPGGFGYDGPPSGGYGGGYRGEGEGYRGEGGGYHGYGEERSSQGGYGGGYHGQGQSGGYPNQGQGGGYPNQGQSGGYPFQAQEVGQSAILADKQRLEKIAAAQAEAHKHKRDEHMGELGALASGAFALYETHKVKTDSEHAGRHKIEAEVAGAIAAGSTGYAVYEHVEKKKVEHVQDGSGREKEKKHHFF